MIVTYFSDTDLAKRYGVTRQTVWRWHRERTDFPRAISLSPGCTRWKLSQIEAWENTKAEVS
ncbi:helix-turn-helix transcriptional regulator [Parasedimentitalea psychrophila]|uniref:AlpA family phage regulatory protein n=1 Tax=Parasedimentitalea psychrophila TaxID=2997337 RepID=A0A9Y2KZX0_9RHOB|nr:AlpA family phage regulatory protein [Parasedimentitalea psychrophila]WIY24817.1 AlpA family phage regulatory protein [Parasedimentitalea psychrophila]